MSRVGRLALGAGLGGFALTLLLVAALDPPPPAASAPVGVGAIAPDPVRMIERCRTITAADAECEAAWAERRQRFFGEGKDKR